jgi:hypothetical protein
MGASRSCQLGSHGGRATVPIPRPRASGRGYEFDAYFLQPGRASPSQVNLHGIGSKTQNRQRLGCDRLDVPPLTHRLNDQAAPAPTRHQQAATSPNPKALH